MEGGEREEQSKGEDKVRAKKFVCYSTIKRSPLDTYENALLGKKKTNYSNKKADFLVKNKAQDIARLSFLTLAGSLKLIRSNITSP